MSINFGNEVTEFYSSNLQFSSGKIKLKSDFGKETANCIADLHIATGLRGQPARGGRHLELSSFASMKSVTGGFPAGVAYQLHFERSGLRQGPPFDGFPAGGRPATLAGTV
jgi:hypothetical protein